MKGFSNTKLTFYKSKRPELDGGNLTLPHFDKGKSANRTPPPISIVDYKRAETVERHRQLDHLNPPATKTLEK